MTSSPLDSLKKLTELRETSTFISLMKYIRDTDKQPAEETHRVRSERVLSTGISSPWSWGTSPLGMSMVHPPGSSWNSMLLGFYGRFLMQAQSIITSTSSPLPFQEGGEVGLKIPSFNHCLVFLVTSPHPGAYVESPHQKIHRIQELSIRKQGERPNIRRKDSPMLLSFKKLQEFWQLCDRKRG